MAHHVQLQYDGNKSGNVIGRKWNESTSQKGSEPPHSRKLGKDCPGCESGIVAPPQALGKQQAPRTGRHTLLQGSAT